jgi:hypothetical protein
MAGDDAPKPREETLGLAYAPEHGVWRGALPGRDMTVLVAGSADGPDRERLTAARAVLERLDDLAAVLAAHLAEAEVPMVDEGAGEGEGEAGAIRHPAPPVISWVALEASAPERPDRVAVAFRTGHPNARHIYVAEVAGDAVEDVTAVIA